MSPGEYLGAARRVSLIELVITRIILASVLDDLASVPDALASPPDALASGPVVLASVPDALASVPQVVHLWRGSFKGESYILTQATMAAVKVSILSAMGFS